MKRLVFVLGCIFFSLPLAYFTSLYTLRASLPEFTVHSVAAEEGAQATERSLPFFGLMTPVPKVENYAYIPRLEYRQGPPKRYLSKLSFLLIGPEKEGKEKIEYYGRRTLDDWFVRTAEKLAPPQNWSYADFVQASFNYASTGAMPEQIPTLRAPLAKIFFLIQARRVLGRESADIYVMNQAGIPAFLFVARHRASLGETAQIWFFRRNTLYEVKLAADSRFRALDPREIFRRTFLVEKRQDAMAFVANELSEVKLNTGKLENLSFAQLEWPLLLLGAKLSVDPSSIHAFFHFAGLNALLFREHGKSLHDLEVVDSIRNNVLVSERYGRDVAPESEQSNEMGRLARALVRMLQ